ncbi:MAG: hypothetical protein QF593_00695 [Nitrospinota bacterium]|nr:hypothetical protein [Nitrospinota bacterium]
MRLRQCLRVLFFVPMAAVYVGGAVYGGEGGVKSTRKRTYIKGYTVQDGIAIPETGVVEDGAKLKVKGIRGGSGGRRGKSRIDKGEKKKLDEFFGVDKKSKKQPEVPDEPKRKPRSVRARATRASAGSIVVTGTIELRGGKAALVVREKGAEKVYILHPVKRMAGLFETMAKERTRAVVIGEPREAEGALHMDIKSYIAVGKAEPAPPKAAESAEPDAAKSN